jgi:hypothetical protein
MRSVPSKYVYCPICNRQFTAIPGSDCFCACGAAFRVKLDGTGIESRTAEVKSGSRASRRPLFLGAN